MRPELNDDDLRAIFADYKGTQSPRVRPAGVSQARRRGLSRRRRRYGFLSVAAVLGLLAPLAGFVLASGRGVPIGADLPKPERSDAVPAGGLTRAQLLASSIQMPAFEGDPAGFCPRGEVGLSDSRIKLYKWPDTGQYMSYVDSNRDGSTETVLHAQCVDGEKVVAEQILVVEPGQATEVKLVGRVVGTGGEISAVGPLATQPDGTINVTVSGPRTCCDTFYTAAEHQSRAYAWRGQEFTQVGGSIAFGQRPPADIVISAPQVHFEGGLGMLRLTVTNVGPVRLDSVLLTLVAIGGRVTSDGWGTRAPGFAPGTVEFIRPIEGLEVGEFFTADIGLKIYLSDAGSWSFSATAVGIVEAGGLSDQVRDANPQDNEKVEMELKID